MYLHVSVSEMSFLYLGHVLQQSPEERHPPPAFVPPPPVTITAATPESESPPSLKSGKYRCFVVQIVIVIEYMIFFMSWFSKELLKLWFICIVSIFYKNFLCTSLYLIKDKLFCTFHFLIYIYSYHKWLLSFSAILLLQYSYIYISTTHIICIALLMTQRSNNCFILTVHLDPLNFKFLVHYLII